MKYTNEARARAGLGPLAQGSSGMLNNAMQHNRHMAARGSLYHQNIGSVPACGGTLSAENVAQNFRGPDPARACVDQVRHLHLRAFSANSSLRSGLRAPATTAISWAATAAPW